MSTTARHIVFLMVQGVHLLDLSGPAQVFSSASTLLERDGRAGYELHFVAETPSVITAQGLPVTAATEWPDLAEHDLVVVPGWRVHGSAAGTGAIGEATLDRLRRHHDAGGTVASVCAGADALGRAGLLDGRRCTTHHELQHDLARRYPRARVVPDVLFTSDDRVVSSAGIASGIDLALQLVADEHGAATAARVARTMVLYARRNGDAPQASAMLRHRDHLDDAVHRTLDLIDGRYGEPLGLDVLSAAVTMSPRGLTRAFVRATGLTPLRYQHELRLERADQLVAGGASLETAARTVGFTDARMLRRLRSRRGTVDRAVG